MPGKSSTVFCLLIGFGALLPSGAARAQADKPPEFLKKITDRGPAWRPKLGKGYRAVLNLSQGTDVKGIHIGFYSDYLLDKYPEFREEDGVVSIGYLANEKEIIAAFGLLYRVTAGNEKLCTIEWIPPKEVPEGLKVHADSIFVPFKRIDYGGAAFRGAGVRFIGVGNAIDAKSGPTAKLAIQVTSTLEKHGGKWEATVKTGDLVLINEKAHKVRAVVPPDEKTRVVGWVELDAKPIPRADLDSDRIPFIQPQLVAKATPAGYADTIAIHRHPYKTPSYVNVAVVVDDPAKPEGLAIVDLPGYTIHFPRFHESDIVALAGFLYKYRTPPGGGGDMPPHPPELRWIGYWEFGNHGLPGGTTLPSHGSLFVPLQKKGAGGIAITKDRASIASLCFLRHQKMGEKEEIVATMVAGKADDNLTPTTQEFTVRTGDHVLVAAKGYTVRAIVPDQKNGVRGWVELDANGIPETDLIRNKTPFVRPTPKDEKPK